MTKDELIADAIKHKLTKSDKPEEAVKEFACYNCKDEPLCQYAWDLYNIGEVDGYCLASK